MNLEKIEKSINEAFKNKDKIDSSDKALNELVRETIDLLDNGRIRVAEKKGDKNGKLINGLKGYTFKFPSK